MRSLSSKSVSLACCPARGSVTAGAPKLGLSGAELVAPPSLKADIETGRRGDGHHGHHAALDRVAHHQVRGFGYAAGHIQREHDYALLPDLIDSPGNLSPHERTRQ